eukprot:sb/3463801/
MPGVILLLLLAARSQLSASYDILKLDGICDSVKECHKGIASFTVSAVKNNDELAFLKSYGYANNEDKIPAVNETRFSIGSISKSFTAYLASKYVQEGKIRWDQTLTEAFADYGVEFSFVGENRDHSLTITDALSHRTGLKTYDWLLVDGRNYSKAYWITKLLPHFEQEVSVRYNFIYNNWLYSLIGYLLELIGGKPFEDQIREVMFEPLGMTETMFVSDEAYRELSGNKIAVPYKEGKDSKLFPIPQYVMEYIGFHNPAGGIVSTAGDMAKYMGALLNAYNDEPGSILDRDTLLNITEPRIIMNGQIGDLCIIHTPIFPVTEKQYGYAMGYIAAAYREYQMINHGGSTYGQFSQMSIIPEKKIGVFTALSGYDALGLPHQIQRLIYMYFLDSLMEVEPWLNSSSICTFPKPWTDACDGSFESVEVEYMQPRENLTIYEGIYYNPVYPDLNVTLHNGTLMFVLGLGNGTLLEEKDKPLHSFTAIINLPTDAPNIPEYAKERCDFNFLFETSEKSVSFRITMYLVSLFV